MLRISGPSPVRIREWRSPIGWEPSTEGQMQCVLSAVCFLAIVAFADAGPAAAQQACVCFCRVQGEGGGGCWVDVPGCNPRSGVRTCNDGAMCGYNCVPPASPLDGARRALILSGNIIGQPSTRGSGSKDG